MVGFRAVRTEDVEDAGDAKRKVVKVNEGLPGAATRLGDLGRMTGEILEQSCECT